MQLTCYDISAIRGWLRSEADPEEISRRTGYDVQDILKVKKTLEQLIIKDFR